MSTSSSPAECVHEAITWSLSPLRSSGTGPPAHRPTGTRSELHAETGAVHLPWSTDVWGIDAESGLSRSLTHEDRKAVAAVRGSSVSVLAGIIRYKRRKG